MSLRPQAPPSVPEETRRIARAAFPKGTLCLRIADALGLAYQDSQFAALFPRRGRPAEAPGRLALAVVLQFAENLSDHEAAEAVQGRIDWKYALGLPYAVLDSNFCRLAAKFPYGNFTEKTLMDKLGAHRKSNIRKSATCGILGRLLLVENPFSAALSRQQHRFQSDRGRHANCVKTTRVAAWRG